MLRSGFTAAAAAAGSVAGCHGLSRQLCYIRDWTAGEAKKSWTPSEESCSGHGELQPQSLPQPLCLPGSAPTPSLDTSLFFLCWLTTHTHTQMSLSVSFFSLSKVFPQHCLPEVTMPPSGSILVSIPFPSVASHCALSGNSREHPLGSLRARPLQRKWWAVESLSAGCQMGNGFSTRCLGPPRPLPQI